MKTSHLQFASISMVLFYGVIAVAQNQTAPQGQLPALDATSLPALPAPAAQAPTPPSTTVAPKPVAAPSAPTATVMPVSPTATASTPDSVPATASPSQSSMGTSNISLFFTTTQVNALRNALAVYESNRSTAKASPAPVSEPLAVEGVKINEPDSYPVFYLSSIVYHSATDWSLWVSGHKITSRKNPTSLQVLSISPVAASFLWQPSYNQALIKRKTEHLFANVDPVKNKLTIPSNYTYDIDKGTVTFTLKPNQSFVAGYFDTFEGFVDSPKLQAFEPPKAATSQNKSLLDVKVDAPTSAAAPPVNAPPKGLIDQSLDDIKKHL